MINIKITTLWIAFIAFCGAGNSFAESCKPTFHPTAHSRILPHAYVDQALDTLPHMYPHLIILLERRASYIGSIAYSLLVYKKDLNARMTNLEGSAVHYPDAWIFKAESENAMDCLVTTLEGLVKLDKLKE